jgi:23S rRNA (cytosine1962-C5)-methyltransferase
MKHETGIVKLKAKADRPVLRRHPWVFSGAVERVEGRPGPGDMVRVTDGKGGFLARGLYSPESRIRVRLLDWSEKTVIDDIWWFERLKRSVSSRHSDPAQPGDNARRLVYSESDGLPGLIVDRYGNFLVLQALTPGTDRIREVLARSLMEITGAKGVYERSDGDTRSLEGLPSRSGLLVGEAPPDRLEVMENGLRFLVDLKKGQKTGFYLDQRRNRRIAATYAPGREVLDVFAHSGAFATAMLAGGAASATMVESSVEAMAAARENLKLNGLDEQAVETVAGDAFQVLRTFRDQGREFDLIVLDPPKFAPTKAQVSKAGRGYKDINLFALKLLRPNGLLITFSCSGGVDADLFQKIVFGAALDAGREVQILEKLSQAPDHPVLLFFPESAYLKGLVCRNLTG